MDANKIVALLMGVEEIGLGYTYRKKKPVNSTTAGAQTNYPMKLLVGESSGASGEEIDCEGHCTNFPDDIRFTRADGETKHDYWVESITGTTPNRLATIQIETNSIPASGAVDLYMYYGKSGDSGESDGYDTFEFFDSFDGGTLDTDKWTVINGTPTVNNGLYLDDSERIDTKTWVGNTIAVRAKATFPNETGSSVYAMIGLYDNINLEASYLTYYDWDVRSRTAAGNELTTITAYNGEHILELKKNAGAEAKYYVDDVLKDTDSAYVPDASIPIFLLKTGANDLIIDWILARKYCSPEPTWGTSGAEEIV